MQTKCLFIILTATNGLLPGGIQCACIGDRIIYNCTAVGGGTTIWSGTVLDCPLDGSVITLRHSQYASNQAFGFCNDGDISGRGIDVTNNCYTSQLSLTVRGSFANKTVHCILNSNEGIRTIGESLLSIVSGTYNISWLNHDINWYASSLYFH